MRSFKSNENIHKKEGGSYYVVLLSNNLITKWAASWQNQLCSQRRLRSAWAFAQSEQSSLCAQWVAKDPRFLHVDSEDWSDWADAQADLSPRWAHIPFSWFCHEAAQIRLGQVGFYKWKDTIKEICHILVEESALFVHTFSCIHLHTNVYVVKISLKLAQV